MTRLPPPSARCQHAVLQMQGARAQVLEPEKSCEITTTVSPALRRRSSSSRSSPRWLGGVEPGQRLVEDERARRAGQQPGQHHAAHLAAAELVDPSLRQRGIQADGGQCLDHPRVVA